MKSNTERSLFLLWNLGSVSIIQCHIFRCFSFHTWPVVHLTLLCPVQFWIIYGWVFMSRSTEMKSVCFAVDHQDRSNIWMFKSKWTQLAESCMLHQVKLLWVTKVILNSVPILQEIIHTIADCAVNIPRTEILLELHSAFSLVVFTD